MIKLDDWQRKVLDTKGDICLRSGRQVGKSTVVSLLAGDYAISHRNVIVMIIASVERQAYLLFEKVLAYLNAKYKNYIKLGRDRPTRSQVKLKNGSIIYCLPTGLTGHGIRGYTIDMLIADEAAFIPDTVYASITPALATRSKITGEKRRIILLSTPFGKQSYFYRCFNDPNFTKFHVSSLDCERIDKNFLERERERMSRLQFQQEYEGQFIDELLQFFPTQLITDNMTLSRNVMKTHSYIYFLGVDVAGKGADDTVYVVVERTTDGIINVKDIIIRENARSTDIIRQIKALTELYDLRRIYIDDGGLGAPIFDVLLEDDITRGVVEGINNSAKPLDRDDTPKRRRILKEDLYHNTLSLLERKKLNLIKSPELLRSMTSMQYEYTAEGRIKIFGNYSHITEALIRACWCIKDKSLNIWITSI